MSVYVDDSLCISCGFCVGTEPEVFRFNENGVSEAYGEVTAENEAKVRQALEGCPTEAIKENSHNIS